MSVTVIQNENLPLAHGLKNEVYVFMCGALVSAQGCVIFGISFCFTFLEREIL